MAGVNRVFLIGVVAAPPTERGGTCEFVLGVPEERGGTAWLERVHVVTSGQLAEAARELRPAQAVYLDGRLTESSDGALVVARAVLALGDPPPDPAPVKAPAGNHASPRAHDRVGHPRRLHAGTPRERVIWIRPTRVGDPAATRRRRGR